MNRTKMKYIGILCGALITTSCSVSNTSRFFEEASGPPIRELGLRSVKPSEVVIRTIDPAIIRDRSKFKQWQQSNRTSRNLVFLGSSEYSREGRPSQEEIRLSASRLGAKVAYVDMPYAGKGQKTIEVPIARTSGRTITHNSDSYGSISGSGSTYGTYGGTPYDSNTRISGSYSGSTTSSTYIPGTTLYGTRDVSYDSFDILVMFYVPEEHLSEEGMRKVRAARDESKRY